MAKSTAHISIDLDDVRRAGGVRSAILQWCHDSDTTASGVVGPSFSTSGPGSGYSIQYDESDYAARAIGGGAMHYVDEDDGTAVSAVEVAKDDDDGTTYSDDDGNTYDEEQVIYCDGICFVVGEWTTDSVVEIVCPDIKDALQHPDWVAKMAQSVIDHHGAESDRAEWKSLIVAIKAAAEAVDDIDVDDLDD